MKSFIRHTEKEYVAIAFFAIGILMALFAPIFPRLYNTTEEVRYIASRLLMIVACAGPVNSFCHCCYFTLRSGGKTWITFAFDSAYLWILSIPLARLLTGATMWPILPIYMFCTFIDVIKAFAGGVLIKKDVWVHNIVSDN